MTHNVLNLINNVAKVVRLWSEEGNKSDVRKRYASENNSHLNYLSTNMPIASQKVNVRTMGT